MESEAATSIFGIVVGIATGGPVVENTSPNAAPKQFSLTVAGASVVV